MRAPSGSRNPAVHSPWLMPDRAKPSHIFGFLQSSRMLREEGNTCCCSPRTATRFKRRRVGAFSSQMPMRSDLHAVHLEFAQIAA